MMVIGCDFHTRYQQIAMMDEATGELIEQRLDHESGEAHAFYRGLQGPVRVGIEATGPIRWFERMLAELGHELWIGDSAKIRASEVRKQKTDERDALLILDLLLAKRFPKIWVPTPGAPSLRSKGGDFLLHSIRNFLRHSNRLSDQAWRVAHVSLAKRGAFRFFPTFPGAPSLRSKRGDFLLHSIRNFLRHSNRLSDQACPP